MVSCPIPQLIHIFKMFCLNVTYNFTMSVASIALEIIFLALSLSAIVSPFIKYPALVAKNLIVLERCICSSTPI